VDLTRFENHFEAQIKAIASNEDPAHDLSHFHRVVKTAKQICQTENGLREVVVPAAWLHDCVIIPKNDPRRSKASQLSAEYALKILQEIEYPAEHFAAISHAIEAHSFSANIPARTLEAKIVQDADRLDGLGAIGIARCFATAGLLKRPFYSEDDPFCELRAPNDRHFTIDHFYAKLFKTAVTLHTASGKAEGTRRVESMRTFLSHLREEITADPRH
jgi:uncharacterized protein